MKLANRISGNRSFARVAYIHFPIDCSLENLARDTSYVAERNELGGKNGSERTDLRGSQISCVTEGRKKEKERTCEAVIRIIAFFHRGNEERRVPSVNRLASRACISCVCVCVCVCTGMDPFAGEPPRSGKNDEREGSTAWTLRSEASSFALVQRSPAGEDALPCNRARTSLCLSFLLPLSHHFHLTFPSFSFSRYARQIWTKHEKKLASSTNR